MAQDIKFQLLRNDSFDRDGSMAGSLWMFKNNGFVEAFTTVERGKGYVHFHVGTYEMTHSAKRSGAPLRCLRPVEAPFQAILIHAAGGPKQLLGCVAPRVWNSNMTWNNSAAAMERIWKLCGGWEAGKKVSLEVLNGYP